MKITSEAVKKAFAPITTLKSQQRVQVDPAKVVTSLIDDMAKVADADDPLPAFEALEKRVNAIDAILEKASEDEHGNLFVLTADDVAKEFAPAPPPAENAEADKAKGKAKAEDEEMDEEAEEIKGGKGKTTKTEESEVSTDKDGWPSDLSPAEPPVRRSERATEAEVIVPARKSAREKLEKWRENRDRALANRGAGRCMS